ncbi:ceramidase [Obelidium mucronatum]|nr:ceramidase [Obelidium mucronatum]
MEQFDSNIGIHGPVTSTMDWCEENYIVTPWIAEFYNSISNVAYLITTIIGLKSVRAAGITDKRTYLALYSMAVVGIGSFLFHCSLNKNNNKFNLNTNTLLAFGLFLYAATITLIYTTYRTPLFFQISYGFLALSAFLVPPLQFKHLKYAYPEHKARLPGLWRLYWFAFASYLAGFVLWNIDNHYCSTVRWFRGLVGYPWSVLLQLHVWWHVGTAVGIYSSVVGVVYLRQVMVGREDVYIKWVFAGFLPVLRTELGCCEIECLSKLKRL